MSEDRTQTATPKHRQEARERGLVAHSRHLTGALGLVATLIALAVLGPELWDGFQRAGRNSWSEVPELTPDLGSFIALIWQTTWLFARPMLMILCVAVMMIPLIHQLQVGGLWVAGVLAPDPSRLWTWGTREEDASSSRLSKISQGVWPFAKSLALVLTLVLVMAQKQTLLDHAPELELPTLLSMLGGMLIQILGTLAVVAVMLGLLDYGLQWRRHEARLVMTTQQHREEQASNQSDPAIRARRRTLVSNRRQELSDYPHGSTFLVLGQDGLTVVVRGGPAPEHTWVSKTATGTEGYRLRAALRVRCLSHESPALALRLANRPQNGPEHPLPGNERQELDPLWHLTKMRLAKS